ncbi:protein SLENDER RICE1-LIKE 1 [Elaeis guineensis]|uniref:DELLA protein n=1 Tax=Elaeis guineensis var. tenera TaxID=51953 RepID=A0A6I9RLU9_ELAGV|nr:DELLA protein DWARF8 [Elaeis guineensis]
MGPYPFGSGTAASGWAAADSGPQCSASEIDGLLAGAGYRVRSSDLLHVAHSLERLESAIGGGPADHLASAEAVRYNPSDLTTWVNSILSELSSSLPPLRPPPAAPVAGTWPDLTCFSLPYPQYQTAVIAATRQREEEEGSAIRLVHLLVTCADAVQRGDSGLAGNIIEEMRVVLTRVNTGFGIGKVAGYFVDALCRRIYSPCSSSSSASVAGSAADQEILYHHFYEVSPYLKFAHFMANQAILEAFDGYDRVHVIDFNLMDGLQWPALIQALALRAGGPPFLRLTGIGPPSPDGRDALREVGLRLAELALSVRVRFAFRGVAASRIDDVRPWMLQVVPGEAVAVNSVLQLHRLLGDPGDDAAAPIDSVLGWIVRIQPKIVTVVEQEADHNRPSFLDRFTEALFYYSTMFDSLEAGGGATQKQQQAVAEVYLQREVCNIVCCEGAARVERHEPLVRWRARLGRAGLRAVHLGSNAFKQASMLLTLFSGEGYCVEEVDGCLTLGWHSRPLISASAWRADADVAPLPDSQLFNPGIAATINSTSISGNDNNNTNNFQSMHHGSGNGNAAANNQQNNATCDGGVIGL